MQSAERKLTLTAGWVLMALGVWTFAHREAMADDPQHQTESAAKAPCSSCQLRATIRVSEVPILSKIPYLGRLFENDALPVETDAERIGVDFEITPGGIVCVRGDLPACGHECAAAPRCEPELADQLILFAPSVCPTTACATAACPKAACSTASCPNGVCEPCCSDEFIAAVECLQGTSECPQATCAGGKSCPFAAKAHVHVTKEAVAVASPCQTEICQAAPGKLVACGAETCRADCVGKGCNASEVVRLREQVEELMQAVMEARIEKFEEREGFMESMVEVMTEKIEAQCKLKYIEMVSQERERSFEKMMELVSENRHLKSMVEFAQSQQANEQLQMQMAIENERLKLRVAELEKLAKGAEEQQELRTAKKTSAGKRVR